MLYLQRQIYLSIILICTTMVLNCRNDYGVIQVTFAGLSVHLCDAASCELFEVIKKYLLRAGENFSIDYFSIDTERACVNVFTLGAEFFVPTLTFHVRHLFHDDNSYLLKLYNIFAPKKHRLYHDENGKPVKFCNKSFHSGMYEHPDFKIDGAF